MGSYEPPMEERCDVLIIGAGLSGICSLHHIRERFPSWRVKVLEAREGVGGTWFWNRYPGARFDSESLSYAYSWDKELLDEWHWKEAFSPQPETLKYIERVCEKHDLYKDIILNTRIKSAQWQNVDHTRRFVDEGGKEFETRFFPKDFDLKRDFANKNIGVIGTGATGIQTITAISKEPSIKSLSVFQRTANWSAPLRNLDITLEQMAKHKTEYDEIFKRCAETTGCFLHQADIRKSSEMTDEERLALWEQLYAQAGFGKWLSTFSNTCTDREANRLYSDSIANKIRGRVHDPLIAESLIPKKYGFGTRHVPLESGYFEAYNQSNVHLIDLQKTPIEKITKKGAVTSDGTEHELDILVFATGFNAITGAFSAIDWHAKDDRPLLGGKGTKAGERAIWIDHCPETFLGLTTPAMPNTFMVLGPHQPFGNATRSIEHAVQSYPSCYSTARTMNTLMSSLHDRL